MTDRKITWIECNPDETAGLVDAPQANPNDNEPGYQEHVAAAMKRCRCAMLFAPCDGVLAGGMCDELWQDDYEREYWDEEQDDDD